MDIQLSILVCKENMWQNRREFTHFEWYLDIDSKYEHTQKINHYLGCSYDLCSLFEGKVVGRFIASKCYDFLIDVIYDELIYGKFH